VCRTCDLLEVLLGRGGGPCSHRSHILVYICEGATPSHLCSPHSPRPSDLFKHSLLSISEQPLSPYCTEPSREGSGGYQRTSGGLRRGRLPGMEELSGAFPECPVPASMPQGDPIRALALWGNKGKFPLVAASRNQACLIFKATLIS
jgi:hypothetical protein